MKRYANIYKSKMQLRSSSASKAFSSEGKGDESDGNQEKLVTLTTAGVAVRNMLDQINQRFGIAWSFG